MLWTKHTLISAKHLTKSSMVFWLANWLQLAQMIHEMDLKADWRIVLEKCLLRTLHQSGGRSGVGVLTRLCSEQCALFIIYLVKGKKGILVKFTGDIKQGYLTTKNTGKIHNDLDRLESWADTSKMKFNKDKLLHLNNNKNQMCIFRQWISGLTVVCVKRVLQFQSIT